MLGKTNGENSGPSISRQRRSSVLHLDAREKNLGVGSTINLMNHMWRVSGIFESGKLARICARLDAVQTLTGNSRKLSQIYLKVDDPTGAQSVVNDLRDKMPG